MLDFRFVHLECWICLIFQMAAYSEATKSIYQRYFNNHWMKDINSLMISNLKEFPIKAKGEMYLGFTPTQGTRWQSPSQVLWEQNRRILAADTGRRQCLTGYHWKTDSHGIHESISGSEEMEEDTYLLIDGGAQGGFHEETMQEGGLLQEKGREIWSHQHMEPWGTWRYLTRGNNLTGLK